MLELIVLGHIPGTEIFISFYVFSIFIMVLAIVFLCMAEIKQLNKRVKVLAKIKSTKKSVLKSLAQYSRRIAATLRVSIVRAR